MYLRRQKVNGKQVLPVISFSNNRVCISPNYFHLQRVKLHKILTKKKKIKSVIKSNCSQSCVRRSWTKKKKRIQFLWSVRSYQCCHLNCPSHPPPSLGQGGLEDAFSPARFSCSLNPISVASILQKSAAAFAVQNKISRINSFLFSFFLLLSFFYYSFSLRSRDFK